MVVGIEHQMFYKKFARDYLLFLGNPNPTHKQLKGIQLLLSQIWVQKSIYLDDRLTYLERQCLYLSALGHNVKDIASFFAISTRQVERHRSAIFEKLGCRNITQAVAQGIRYGEIQFFDVPLDSKDAF